MGFPPRQRSSLVRCLLSTACLVILLAAVACDDRVGRHSDLRGALDLSGLPVDPLGRRPDGARGIEVLVFMSNDCPLANRYCPEVNRLTKEFSGRGVRFWIVHASPDESSDSIARHAREFELAGTVIRDLDQSLVRKAQVRVTPEAGVFSARGDLVYHGRIDDRAIALGREQTAPTRHDLEDVIRALLDGQPGPFPATKAIGCSIPPVP